MVIGDSRGSSKSFSVSVKFAGGSAPFRLLPTRNCTSCCSGTHTVDLDASADGTVWANATNVRLERESVLVFEVALDAPPTSVRHTAASAFPQCALYNMEGLPLLPFRMDVGSWR